MVGAAAESEDTASLARIIGQWSTYNSGEGDANTADEKENVLYSMFSAFALFVGIHIKRSVKRPKTRARTKARVTRSSSAAVHRLLLPSAKSDYKLDGFDEHFKVDSLLTPCEPDVAVEPQDVKSCHDVFAFAEFKKNTANLDDALNQLILYSRAIYMKQHHRRFAWALAGCAKQMYACVLLHDAVLVSPAMDIATPTGRKQLIGLFVNWSLCEEHQLGYDPTIRYDSDRDLWTIDCFDDQEDSGAPHQYSIEYVLFPADNLLGRHTRCFVASPLSGDSDGPRQVVIKDSWAAARSTDDDDDRSEIKLLGKIKDTLASKNVDFLYPEMVHGGHVRFMINGNVVVDTTDSIFNLFGTSRLEPPDMDYQESLQTNSAASGNDADLWKQQYLRAHRRIVLTPIGKHIKQVKDQTELIVVLADAMRCHSAVNRHCNILHRDISTNNILAVDVPDSLPRGLLIDFDYGLATGTVRKGSQPECLGTLPFMSIGNLTNSDTRRTALDDWESLLYLVCWTATVGITSEDRKDTQEKREKEMEENPFYIEPPIFNWKRGTPIDIARQKFSHMDTAGDFKLYILGKFWPRYRGLKMLAKELHKALFLHKGCEGAVVRMVYPEYNAFDWDMPSSEAEANSKLYNPLAMRLEHEKDIINGLETVMERFHKRAYDLYTLKQKRNESVDTAN
ncbi:hypothetical protein H4R20_000043 [Coemansia guatemalensis]|uniref:Fungal-type protein kinase domain-containing protein n=1 Tax=Coemansia guatemalensis TaxID=2761395 RepID=A0A9W8I4N3_9FUNG|nr:hypothetical protein H4R20_000043 [Coemansia guatemalensis]